MIITAWVVIDPGADRPYFWHRPPTDLDPKEGRQIFEFHLEIPSPVEGGQFIGSAEVKELVPTAGKE